MANITPRLWLNSIQTAVSNVQLQGKLKVSPFTDKKRFLSLISPEVMEDVFSGYVNDVFLPAVHTEYMLRASRPREYSPFIEEGSAGFDIHDTSATPRNPDWQVMPRNRMPEGFRELWNRISKTQRLKLGGGKIGIGIGPSSTVTSLSMNAYMPHAGGMQTQSKYNVLFFGVEFGTGTVDNVGGPAFLRLDGPTKERDGSWWLGDKVGQGAHFKGQKGFHFLFEERTRRPREYYAHLLDRTLPSYVSDYFRRVFGFQVRIR